MAPKAPYLPSETVLHTSRGRSPQPVREASENPGSPGPKGPAAGSTLTPVRACQPSGILESTAPVPIPIPTAPQAPDALSPSPQQAGKQVIEGRKALRSGRRGEIDTLLSWRGGIFLRPAGLLLLKAVFWPVPVLRPARRFLLLLFLPYPGSSLLRE